MIVHVEADIGLAQMIDRVLGRIPSESQLRYTKILVERHAISLWRRVRRPQSMLQRVNCKLNGFVMLDVESIHDEHTIAARSSPSTIPRET